MLAWCRANPALAIGGLLVALGLATGGGENLSQGQAVNQGLRQYRESSEVFLKRAELGVEQREKAIPIAEARKRTCLSSTLQDGTPVAIQEGLAFLDPVTNQPLPDGTTVCDRYGNTAEVVNGVLTNLVQGIPDQGYNPEPKATEKPTFGAVIYAPATKKD